MLIVDENKGVQLYTTRSLKPLLLSPNCSLRVFQEALSEGEEEKKTE